MQIVICDDDPHILSELEKTIQEVAVFAVHVRAFSSLSLLEEWLFHTDCLPDLLILDIEIGEENGISFAERVHQMFPRILLIFLSGYYHYVTEIFSVSPFYFLRKPIEPDKVQDAILSARKRIFSRCTVEFAVQEDDGSIVSFSAEHVTTIVRDRHRYTIYSNNAAPRCFFGRLEELTPGLPAQFCRVRSNCLVNLQFVREIRKGDCILQNGEVIPMESRFREDVRNRFFAWIRREVYP